MSLLTKIKQKLSAFRQKPTLEGRLTNASHEHGFSLMISLVVTVISVGVVSGLVTFVKKDVESIVSASDTLTAEQLAVMGMEETVSTLADDEDWSDNSSQVTGSYNEGTYTVTLSDQLEYSVTVTSIGYYDNESYTLSRSLVREQNMARDLDVDVSQVNLTQSYTRLEGIELTNNGSSDVEITGAIVSWSYDPNDGVGSEKIEEIEVEDTDVWNPPSVGSPTTDQASGQSLTWASTVTISSSQSKTIDLHFTDSIANKVVSVVFLLSDGTSVVADYASDIDTQAEMLNVDVSDIEYKSNNKKIEDIELTNLGDISITVSSITLSWEYDDPAIKIKKVHFDNKKAWQGNKSSGSVLSMNTNRSTISAGDDKELKLQFSSDCRYRLYTMLFTMSDGSTKNVTLDERINQADYLTIDTSEAIIINDNLVNVTLENSHSKSSVAKIWVDDVQVNLDPDDAQTIETITIDDVDIFESDDEPDDLNTWLAVDQTNIDDEVDIELAFSELEDEKTVTLSFRMRDDTVATANFSVTEGDPAATQLTVDKSLAYVQSNRKNVLDINLSNSGSSAITIETLTISWDPINNKKLKRVKANNSTVYNKGAGVASGTLLALSTTIKINSGQTKELKLYYKQSSMANRDFSIVFGMSDSSEKTVDLKFNPSSGYWAAADNFEDGKTFSGGHGFAANWSSDKSASSRIKSSQAFSGKYVAEFKGNQGTTYLERQVTSSAQVSSITLNVTTKVKGLEGSDYAILETKVGTGSWQTSHDFSNNQNNSYVLSTVGLTPTIGEPFYIRFEFNANKSNEAFYVDEIYLK